MVATLMHIKVWLSMIGGKISLLLGMYTYGLLLNEVSKAHTRILRAMIHNGENKRAWQLQPLAVKLLFMIIFY